MRENIRDWERLEHILSAIDVLLPRLPHFVYEDWLKSPYDIFAAAKQLEIIGEASNLLTNEFRLSHPEIPWRAMINMRHILVHDYYALSPTLIWQTMHEDLPMLRPLIERLLKDIRNQ